MQQFSDYCQADYSMTQSYAAQVKPAAPLICARSFGLRGGRYSEQSTGAGSLARHNENAVPNMRRR